MKETVKLSIFQRKGGCAKTTTAINLAGAFVEAHKKSKVLIVDCDSQSHIRANLIDNVPEEERTEYTIVDVINKECSLKDAIMQAHITKRRNLVPVSVYFIQTPITDGAFTNKKGKDIGNDLSYKDAFCHIFKELEEEFDLIIFDLPPVLSNGLGVQGIYYSDYVILPTQLTKTDLDGLQTAYSEIENFKSLLDTDVINLGVLISIYNSKATVQNDLGEELSGALGDELFQTRIKQATVVQQASAMNEPVVFYAPGSPAAFNFRTFEKEFEKRLKKNKR